MKKYKLASSDLITLRCYEQPGSLTIEQWLSSLDPGSSPSGARIEAIHPGAVLQNRDGSYWRVNSIYAPTGFCLIEECNSQGSPMKRYTAMSITCFVAPFWSLVKLPRSARRFSWVNWLATINRWLHE
ncbi:hypothetical protein HNV11_11950 [Spirosoma taeanense]|uniref:Uncharacterized protein n=1 Tax=Spirosoma taeanense TaxID=2735870 RepID=A0A6M5Y7Z7_9BACT|nr:hypothetical protein [Spirosoma taeanense]QJW90035.1 hypothetical protein HNV11_11950 [Spirosoma taeanense]